MRIKNFRKFVNENLKPHSVGDKHEKPQTRFGEPVFFDKDEFEDEEWTPTGDKPRKLDPEDEPSYINKDNSDKDGDKKKPSDKDDEPFISDTDDYTEESDQDYIY